MKRFNKILVGVDLSVGDKMVGGELSPASTEAVDRAIWLAKINSASVQFFYSLDIGYQAQRLVQEHKDTETTVLDKANRELARLVDRAKNQGVEAGQSVTFGKSWLELIHQVLRKEHDLVVVGAKDRGSIERLLIGSTGMKLLRKCPCPVWIAHKPESESQTAILVGHDLTEVGDLALELGASMAELQEVPLHVVHALEPTLVDATEPLAGLAPAGDSNAVQDRISAQLAAFNLKQAAEVHVAAGSPATVLLEHIERYNPRLLVMGTIARSGIEGLLFGNTAERLLPQINCSVIAVKPKGFQSPITLDD